MFTLMRLWKISLIALLASMATAQESSGPCANKKVIVSVVRGAQPFFDLRLENFQAKIGGQPVRIASIASNVRLRFSLNIDANLLYTRLRKDCNHYYYFRSRQEHYRIKFRTYRRTGV